MTGGTIEGRSSVISGRAIPFSSIVTTHSATGFFDMLECLSCLGAFEALSSTAASITPDVAAASSDFTLSGTVRSAAGAELIDNQTILEATYFVAEVVEIDLSGTSAAGSAPVSHGFLFGAGQGTVHENLLTHLELPSGLLFDIGFSAILAAPPERGVGETVVSSVASADIVLTPAVAVPQPGILVMLVVGLVALASLGRQTTMQ